MPTRRSNAADTRIMPGIIPGDTTKYFCRFLNLSSHYHGASTHITFRSRELRADLVLNIVQGQRGLTSSRLLRSMPTYMDLQEAGKKRRGSELSSRTVHASFLVNCLRKMVGDDEAQDLLTQCKKSIRRIVQDELMLLLKPLHCLPAIYDSHEARFLVCVQVGSERSTYVARILKYSGATKNEGDSGTRGNIELAIVFGSGIAKKLCGGIKLWIVDIETSRSLTLPTIPWGKYCGGDSTKSGHIALVSSTLCRGPGDCDKETTPNVHLDLQSSYKEVGDNVSEFALDIKVSHECKHLHSLESEEILFTTLVDLVNSNSWKLA